MPANSHPNVIPFPLRPTTSRKPDPNAELLRAARAAHAALMLAVPNGEKNLVIRKLGLAIRAFDAPEPPNTPASAVKLSESAAAQILRDIRSTNCFCSMGKKAGRPFCLRCFHSLPERMKAILYNSPLDGNQIFDAILEARAYLTRLGMLSANKEIA